MPARLLLDSRLYYFLNEPIHVIRHVFKDARYIFCCYQIKSRILTRKKVPSNKTPALAKSMNMDIWIVGTSNQFFTRGS